MGECASKSTSRKDTHLNANQYVLILPCRILADRNWLVDTIGCVFPFGPPGLYLTLMNQVRNDILSRISRLRAPAELGATEVSCWKMDEVGYMRFHGAPFSEAKRL